jgi:hypothetical protein
VGRDVNKLRAALTYPLISNDLEKSAEGPAL